MRNNPKCLYLILGLMALTIGACKGNEFTPDKVTENNDGTYTFSALIYVDGEPLSCRDNAECDRAPYSVRDLHFNGAFCNTKGQCESNIKGSACDFDPETGTFMCPDLQPCNPSNPVPTDCEVKDQCAPANCNKYLMKNAGVCTYEPIDLGETKCGKGVCERVVPICHDGVTNTTECVPGEPTGVEFCDGLDNNCNGETDEGLASFIYRDADGDSYGSMNPADALYSCYSAEGYVETATDCDDSNASVHPGATELCNGVDDNCKDGVDEVFTDLDDSCSVGVGECLNTGTMVCGADGLETLCSALPLNPTDESCNGLDDNCDGAVDEGLGTTMCGLGLCKHVINNCVGGVHQDCDPYQGKTDEACNGWDDDCDGLTDENLTRSCYYGPTGTSGVGACHGGIETCAVGGWDSCVGEVVPAPEKCNGIDDDCDGLMNEPNSEGCINFYYDGDGDNYGTSDSQCLCYVDGNYRTTMNGDCDDSRANVHPGANETCDGLDNNCDGFTDEGVKNTYYQDLDGDFFGNLQATIQACSQPTGYVTDKTDCNDSTAAVHPGATEICDSLDNDCNGDTDEYATTTYWKDADGDSYGDPAVPIQACSQPTGYVTNHSDCDDSMASVHPGATEYCNGRDDNCNSEIDEQNAQGCTWYYYDVDGDGYGLSNHANECHCQPTGLYQAKHDGDCDDSDASVHPGATEYCNGRDDNCVDGIDEGEACSSCNSNYGTVTCGEIKTGATLSSLKWLNGYSCTSLNESGGEAVFLFQSDKGGVNVTAKPVNLNPSTANTDAFVLEGACVPSACKTFGYLAANWNAEVDELGVGKLYYIVIDGFNGAAASFNLQVTCKETECAGGVDNDDDGLVDCADPDCFADSNCTAKREVCIGGVDEDLDGKTDCADPDCRFDNNCVSSCATQDQITCGESKIDNTLSYSNMISGYDCAALDESGPEKAYIFTAETSGTITISLSNLGADMDVFVLEDLCQANECLGWGNNSTTVQVVAGHTYYVVVDGFAGSSGSYTVSLNCFPVQ